MRKRRKQREAFSLVEVVLALGVCVFCLLVLQGMFLVGVNASQESTQDVQASNIASFLIAQRRANPTNAVTATYPPSPIVPLTITATNASPIYLTDNGQQTNAASATYQLNYSIQTNTFNVAQLGITLSAPANATLANAKTRYDVLTYVNLP